MTHYRCFKCNSSWVNEDIIPTWYDETGLSFSDPFIKECEECEVKEIEDKRFAENVSFKLDELSDKVKNLENKIDDLNDILKHILGYFELFQTR